MNFDYSSLHWTLDLSVSNLTTPPLVSPLMLSKINEVLYQKKLVQWLNGVIEQF